MLSKVQMLGCCCGCTVEHCLIVYLIMLDTGESEAVMCPTIASNSQQLKDYVLQPYMNKNGNGNFSYRLRNRDLFHFEHNIYNCYDGRTINGSLQCCDQLRIRAKEQAVNMSGVFEVIYSELSQPVLQMMIVFGKQWCQMVSTKVYG